LTPARRVDHVAVLRRALPHHARRNQQHALGARQGGVQAGAIAIVGAPHLHAARRQIRRLGRVAHGRHNLRRRHFLQQAFHHQAAQCARSASNNNHVFLRVQE
jgi:hypothetical protein